MRDKLTRKLPLVSSVLCAMAFAPNEPHATDSARLGTLRLWFRSGKVYDYQDVPYGIVWHLYFTHSHGKSYNSMIKGVYHYIRRIGYRWTRKACLDAIDAR